MLRLVAVTGWPRSPGTVKFWHSLPILPATSTYVLLRLLTVLLSVLPANYRPKCRTVHILQKCLNDLISSKILNRRYKARTQCAAQNEVSCFFPVKIFPWHFPDFRFSRQVVTLCCRGWVLVSFDQRRTFLLLTALVVSLFSSSRCICSVRRTRVYICDRVLHRRSVDVAPSWNVELCRAFATVIRVYGLN